MTTELKKGGEHSNNGMIDHDAPTTTATEESVLVEPLLNRHISTANNNSSDTTSDLMSRLSSFLPQIRDANIDLINTQQQHQLLQNSDDNKKQSSMIHQIDQRLLLDDDEDEDESDTDSSDDENNCNVVDITDGIDVHISPNKNKNSNKRRKMESIVCMDIHINQDMDDPLFQALLDNKDTNSSDHDDNNHNPLITENNDDNRNSNNADHDTDQNERNDGITMSNVRLPQRSMKLTTRRRGEDGNRNPLIQEIIDE